MPAKLAASAGVTTVASALGLHLQLMGIFVVLAILDIVTPCMAQAAHLWRDMYPQTSGNVWRYTKFVWQASRWRYIKSEIMRDRFKSKFITYCLILMATSFCDVAMALAGSPKVFLSVVTAVLCFTEMLSVLENLAECGVGVASELMQIIKKRKEAIK